MKTPLQSVYEHEQNLAGKVWLTQPMGDGVLREFTWKDALGEVRRMATHLKGRGYPPGTRIAILSKNCAWWFMTDLAIWMAGYVSVPVYPTLTAESVRAILDHSEARLVFIGKLDHFDTMKDGLPPSIDRIAFPMSPPNTGEAWNDIIGRTTPLEGNVDRSPDELITIMYTSGSTGTPKGVMHSFRSMSHSGEFCELAGITANDRGISYLPLSHVAERALLQTPSYLRGVSIWFVDRLDTFVADVQRARPTIFGSVPRLWMQFQSGVFERVPQHRLSLLLRLPVIGGLVRRKVLRGLGLHETRVAFYGSAPSPVELIAWYRSLGLTLLEIYGMTEDWAISHMARIGDVKPGWVGPPLPGVEQRLTSEGEILVKSPGIMLGYYKSPELTREAIDEEGWLHTGDRGEFDREGRLRITGRVKELFKTSKGKYVAPAPIENRLLAHHEIEQACVSGASMPQPYAIVVLSKHHSRNGIIDSLKRLREEINNAVDPHERLQTIVIASEPWTVENGMLTPTMKLKRNAIEEAYAPHVQAWYDSGEPVIQS